VSHPFGELNHLRQQFWTLLSIFEVWLTILDRRTGRAWVISGLKLLTGRFFET